MKFYQTGIIACYSDYGIWPIWLYSWKPPQLIQYVIRFYLVNAHFKLALDKKRNTAAVVQVSNILRPHEYC